MELDTGKSTENLFANSKTQNAKRILYVILITLSLGVIGLAIGLAVVVQSKNSDVSGVSSNENQAGGAISIPDCIKHSGSKTPELDRANCVLQSYPLIDGHNDLSWQYREAANNTVYSVDLNSDLTKVWNVTHTDIPRLRKGKLGAQFWACYVDCTSQYKDAVRKSLNQLDTIKKFVHRYPDVFQFVTTAQGILDAFKAGKIGSLVGLEGGHSIDSSLANLRMFYDLGVRYMTVTHSCNTPWADNWLVDEPGYNGTVLNGITEFGKKIILEMNRIGMLLDLSHVSKKTMIDVLSITKSPVIYSHSSAFTICPHHRNVQNDVLQMTKENGGVVMVNFYDKYVNCGPNKTNITTFLPVGLEDVSKYPDLFAELIKRGWSDEELRMLAGKNLIRVLTKAEQVRDSLRYMAPYEDLISIDEELNKQCRTV
ncbi:hypothetical protein ACJMK2_023652 [Sinanodonta woodiana]|uniref:Dipeptidase n=1 Tax=Sinanodonta woodiana TaxID=1069815 RepID=A0ABD3T4X0_SINWO